MSNMKQHGNVNNPVKDEDISVATPHLLFDISTTFISDKKICHAFRILKADMVSQ